MKTLEKKTPTGRKPTFAGGPRRQFISMRIGDQTLARLKERAEENKRSYSEEAEARLLMWLEAEGAVLSFMRHVYGPRFTALLMEMGDVMREVDERRLLRLETADGDALSDPWRYDQMVRGVNAILDAHRPEGEIVPPRMVDVTVSKSITAPVATKMLAAQLAEAKAEMEVGERLAAQRLERLTDPARWDAPRELLGPELVERVKRRQQKAPADGGASAPADTRPARAA